MLVAVDDVQWLDSSTRRALSFAARRLGDAPIGILVTQRGDGPDPLDLARTFDVTRFDELRVEPLSLGALAHLIRARLGVRIPRPALARVHDASGGNPMFALEFARSVDAPGRAGARAAVDPDVAAGARPRPHRRAAAGRPSPARGRRGRGAPDPVAARGDRPGIAPVARRRRRPRDRRRRRRGDRPLRAPLAGLGGVRRGSRPRSAALCTPSSLASRSDVEERARHLALASIEPDAEVAAVLDDAAARAHARGAPETAAELAQEAARLTPPADASAAGDREFAVAAYLVDACRTTDASRQLDRVLAIEPAGPASRSRVAASVPSRARLGAAFRALEEALRACR